MGDRTIKTLLIVIALGLWINAASPWLRPMAVQAAQDQGLLLLGPLIEIDQSLDEIRQSLDRMADNRCSESNVNDKAQ